MAIPQMVSKVRKSFYQNYGFCWYQFGPLAMIRSSMALTRYCASVNDDIITQFDLSNRIGLTLISTRTKDTMENRQKVAMAVLRNLIDERLMLAAAKNENITATESEVTEELKALSQRNKLSIDDMTAFFAQRNIDIMALADQFRAQIACANLLRKLSQAKSAILKLMNVTARALKIKRNGVFLKFIPLKTPSESQLASGHAITSKLLARTLRR